MSNDPQRKNVLLRRAQIAAVWLAAGVVLGGASHARADASASGVYTIVLSLSNPPGPPILELYDEAYPNMPPGSPPSSISVSGGTLNVATDFDQIGLGGNLSVTSGGILNDAYGAYLGLLLLGDSDGAGSATIDTGGSVLTSTLIVGDGAAGNLTIGHDATMSSNGTSTYGGQGWDYVGYNGGTGTVQIDAHGSWDAAWVQVGGGGDQSSVIAGNGLVTVSGWFSAAVLEVGTGGASSGILNVSGGYVPLGQMTINEGGIVNVSAGGQINVTQLITNAWGFNYSGGYYLTSGAIDIGAPIGSDGGILDVSDTDSTVTALSMTVGGDTGIAQGGAVSVTAGGQILLSGNMVLGPGQNIAGDQLLGLGDLLVDGTNSRLTVNGQLTIGGGGTGLMNLTNGGQVYSGSGDVGQRTPLIGTAVVMAGFQSASQLGASTSGTVDVDGMAPNGSDSAWNVNTNLTVGDTGNGTLNISNGGAVSTNFGSLIIGNTSFSTGSVTVDGTDENGKASSLQISDDLVVGNQSSTASLTVTNGANVTSEDGLIGNQLHSSGIVNVDGADPHGNPSTWTTAEDFTVGVAGEGIVNVTNSAFLYTMGNAYIGSASSATGTVTVDDSVWQVGEIDYVSNFGNQLNVGVGGNGTLTIQEGGEVVGGSSVLGVNQNSQGTVDIEGEDSDWTNFFFLNIGNDGQGFVTIENHGTASSPNVDIGVDPTGVGTVYVDNATLNCGNNLIVGDAGDGGLTIQNAGMVLSSPVGFANIANQANSTGTISVDGAGSTLQIAQYLNIATSGTGSLAITNGASVSSGSGDIGVNTGAVGTVTVDGAESVWNNASYLTVGDSGTGTLTVSNGGAVTSDNGFIGTAAGSTGTVTITGANSSWTCNADQLIIGYDGIGILNVVKGGSVTSHAGTSASGSAGVIGAEGSGNGTVTIDGAGSQWNLDGFLVVGFGDNGGRPAGGTGILTVSNSGNVTSVGGFIGRFTTGTGTANITGAGSTWNLGSGELTVGGGGTGTLSITSGAAASSASADIGADSTGVGTATVDGTGSAWNISGNLTSGDSGQGSLTISNGGSLTSTGGSIGVAANSIGIIIVTGANSIWNPGANDLTIGGGGTGTLSLSVGTVLSNANATVGLNSGSNGSVIVASPSTKWNLSNLTIGGGGHGVMSISGTASASDINAIIGDQGSGVGRATVDGTLGTSTWNNSGDITVGNSGTGTLNMQHSGKLISDNGIIADALHSTGTATVTDPGSSWTASGEIIVGSSGTGTLNIENKGKVTDAEAHVGLAPLSSGTVLIDGTGSQWVNNGPLTVGEYGTGNLTAQNGGGLNSTNGFLAENTGSSATVLITGPSSLWHLGGSLYVGGSASAAGGAATLTVNKSAQLTVNGTVTIWSSGTVDLDGGSHSFGGLVLMPGGTLEMSKSKLLVAYTGAAPTHTIRIALLGGFAHGNWNGAGIDSASAAMSPGEGIGYMDEGGGEEELMQTFDGDTNLDGVVDGDDLADMNAGGSDWFDGDFNYDGVVNGDDYSLFMLGAAEESQSSGALPEPAAICMLIPAAFLCRRKRRGI